jgi:hypothetical protein
MEHQGRRIPVPTSDFIQNYGLEECEFIRLLAGVHCKKVLLQYAFASIFRSGNSQNLVIDSTYRRGFIYFSRRQNKSFIIQMLQFCPNSGLEKQSETTPGKMPAYPSFVPDWIESPLRM